MRSLVASEGHPPLIMLVTCTMHAATGGDSTRGISRVAAPAAAPRPYGHASGLPPVLHHACVCTFKITSKLAPSPATMQTMNARLLLVGNGEEGTGPALSLSVMRVAQYSKEETPLLQVLVNCGECSCRILNETRTKLSRLSHLLLTSASAASLAGVPSLVFHLSDRGGGDLHIVGPPGTDAYMASIRAFVNRRHPTQHVVQVSHGEEDSASLFRYSTATDDPAPFAWAQQRTPGAGIEMVALPFAAHPAESRHAAANPTCDPQAKRPRLEQSREAAQTSVAYAFVITGPSRPPPAAQGHADGSTAGGSGPPASACMSLVVVVECHSYAAAGSAVGAVLDWLSSRAKDALPPPQDKARRGPAVMIHMGPSAVVTASWYLALWNGEMRAGTVTCASAMLRLLCHVPVPRALERCHAAAAPSSQIHVCV